MKLQRIMDFGNMDREWDLELCFIQTVIKKKGIGHKVKRLENSNITIKME